MYIITKQFSLCFGHRVHSQTLDPVLACTSECKCRHLHGHQGEIIVKLGAEDLKDGMVTDFHHLNWFKKFIDQYFDHKMILDSADPYLPIMLEDFPMPLIDAETQIEEWKNYNYSNNNFFVPNYTSIIEYSRLFVPQKAAVAITEILEGLVVVNFVPTSENLAKMFSNIIAIKLEEELSVEDQKRIWVVAVEFKETPKTSSIYSGGA